MSRKRSASHNTGKCPKTSATLSRGALQSSCQTCGQLVDNGTQSSANERTKSVSAHARST